MNVKEAYNNWAGQYDSNENKTRDLEAVSLRETLTPIGFQYCLEIGCGTGKNTAWLLEKAVSVTAVDLSNEMLSKARRKIQSNKVEFIQADITEDWRFAEGKQFDLVTFSLVLEHIENLDSIFQKIKTVIQKEGYVYIGELHPFKQYSGSKARFETEAGLQIVTCYDHHISDFTTCASLHGFTIVAVNEYFDDNERANIPRILTLLLRRD